jgi:hypothetical protein
MLRKSSLILSSAFLLGTVASCPAADAYLEALGRCRQYSPEEFVRRLYGQRPPLVDPELAARVVASLPKVGEVKRLAGWQVHKLGFLSAVLRAHGREEVYLVKVVDSAQARVGLHARFVLLLTSTTLRLLSPAQLQAIVAHEIGHEYVWDEFEAARREGDWSRLRALELFCDGVALVTMARIGPDRDALTNALRVMAASDHRNGILWDDRSYPSLAERAKFAREISKWLEVGAVPGPSSARARFAK